MGPPSCLHHPAFATEQAVRDTHPSKRPKQLVRSPHILDGLLILIGRKALLFPFAVCYNDREIIFCRRHPMFRDTRRKKNEIGIEESKKLLHSSRRGILAVNGDNNYPYAIPVNYLYDEKNQKIYFHGARSGHKVDAIKSCDKVCFTVFGNETVKDEAWAPFLQSVVIFGRCRLVSDQPAAMALLKRFAMKFYPSEGMVDEEIAVSGAATQMYEIEIEHLSGKEVQER